MKNYRPKKCSSYLLNYYVVGLGKSINLYNQEGEKIDKMIIAYFADGTVRQDAYSEEKIREYEDIREKQLQLGKRNYDLYLGRMVSAREKALLCLFFTGIFGGFAYLAGNFSSFIPFVFACVGVSGTLVASVYYGVNMFKDRARLLDIRKQIEIDRNFSVIVKNIESSLKRRVGKKFVLNPKDNMYRRIVGLASGNVLSSDKLLLSRGIIDFCTSSVEDVNSLVNGASFEYKGILTDESVRTDGYIEIPSEYESNYCNLKRKVKIPAWMNKKNKH